MKCFYCFSVSNLSAGTKEPVLEARGKYAKSSQSAVEKEKNDQAKLINPSKRNTNNIIETDENK